MPYALSIGMTKDEFMDCRPIELMSYGIAYKLNQKRRDEELWLQGLYNMHGFSVVLSNMFNKHSNMQYFKQPITYKDAKDNMNDEQKEEVAVFEMKKRIKMLEKQGLPQSPT